MLDYFKTVADILSSLITFFSTLVNMVVELITFLGTIIISTFNWLLIMIRIPLVISFDLLSELPFVFQYGLIGLFGLVLTIIVLKLFLLIKFW